MNHIHVKGLRPQTDCRLISNPIRDQNHVKSIISSVCLLFRKLEVISIIINNLSSEFIPVTVLNFVRCLVSIKSFAINMPLPDLMASHRFGFVINNNFVHSLLNHQSL